MLRQSVEWDALGHLRRLTGMAEGGPPGARFRIGNFALLIARGDAFVYYDRYLCISRGELVGERDLEELKNSEPLGGEREESYIMIVCSLVCFCNVL
jgi:hypothetical protein